MNRTRHLISRGVIAACMAGALILAVPGAQASSGSGLIQAGQPGTIEWGVTEGEFFWNFANRCAASPRTQGVDGWVIDLAGANSLSVSGSSPTLPGGTESPFSINLHFYSNSCIPINGTGAPQSGPTQPDYHGWSGPLPKDANGNNARWAVVSLFKGAQVTVNYNAYYVP